jgi:hypothetical protein
LPEEILLNFVAAKASRPASSTFFLVVLLGLRFPNLNNVATHYEVLRKASNIIDYSRD